MKKDLFNETIKPETITLNLYCDEIKNVRNQYSGEEWSYCGILIVPTNLETILLEDIIKARFRIPFDENLNINTLDKNDKYYKKNNRIVRYSNLDAETYHIAKRWCDYILNPTSADKIYFNILGINTSRLNFENFGGKSFGIIYNRFFRTAIVYPLLKYFGKKPSNIKYIYHEVGQQMEDDFFPWHSIYKINKNNEWNLNCYNRKIHFLPKDHKKDTKSNFIQLIDSILGSFRNYFDNSSSNEFKIRLTSNYCELVKRLVNYPSNYRSKFCKNYPRRMNIDFFPKEKLDPSDKLYEYKKLKNKFYKKRFPYFLDRKQLKLEI